MKRKIVVAIMAAMIAVVAGCGQTAENTDALHTGIEETIENTDTDVAEGEASTEKPETEGEENSERSETGVDEASTETLKEEEETATENPNTEVTAKVCYIDFAEVEVYFADSAETEAAMPLTLVSEEENGISEISDWFVENNLFLPMLGNEWAESMPLYEPEQELNASLELGYNAFYDDNYIYDWTAISLDIYDRETEQLLYTISYDTTEWYLMGNCAYLSDGILYIGHIYNGYAMPGTCFMMAYDLDKEEVVWRSEDQTYNSMNFVVVGDVIVCAYGFTDEKDYIYQIDMHTGKVIAKTEVKKMPDILVEKDGQLYVHTYSYDYVFNMK